MNLRLRSAELAVAFRTFHFSTTVERHSPPHKPQRDVAVLKTAWHLKHTHWINILISFSTRRRIYRLSCPVRKPFSIHNKLGLHPYDGHRSRQEITISCRVCS